MSTPARLHKKDDSPLMNKMSRNMGDWALAHPYLALIIMFIIVAIVSALVFQLLYGMCTIESGIPRNFMVNDL